MRAQPAWLDHMFSAGLPHRQRRKGSCQLVTRFMLNCLKIEKSKPVAPIKCSFFLRMSSEGSFSPLSLEVRCRAIEAMVSLFGLLHLLPTGFQLSAGSQLLRNYVLKPFMFQSRIEGIEEAGLITYVSTIQQILQIFFETYVLRCLPQVYEIP